jgi:peptidyl-dipeptidase Dcp
MSSSKFSSVRFEMDSRLASYYDKVTQNQALFGRIESIYNSPAASTLTPEQQRLVWLYYTSFVQAGAPPGM